MKFPATFRFGVADADLQVIGEQHTLREEGSALTMWSHCAATSNRSFQHSTPAEGVDRFHRYREDIDLIAGLGVSDYRTSISMSRLLLPDGSVNAAAVAWYREYFGQLTRSGIRVHATLYHWELPLYLHQQGGWANRTTIDFFVRHALAAYEHLGDLISEYFILNEPFCSTMLGHYEGIHAPFENDFRRALAAAHHLLIAQGRAFRALKEKNSSLVINTVVNPIPPYAATAEGPDVEAQRLHAIYSMYWFMDPLFTGSYPTAALTAWEQYMPQLSDEDMQTIKIGPELGALGLNYYGGLQVTHNASAMTKSAPVSVDYDIRNGLGWPVYVPPVYPSGLYDVLLGLHNRYTLLGLKKLMITENGAAIRSRLRTDGTVDDGFRIRYLRDHFTQLHAAIRAGVPIDSYFLWTLMDNYEWAEGYRPDSAFGLVHVDRETLKRTPKDSYYWYRDFVQSRELK